MTERDIPDGLYQRAQTRETSLLAKLADLTDEEWEELTHRMQKHFARALAATGSIVVPRCNVLSSVTDATCVLPAGHPADSPTRFHRFPPP